MRFAIAVTPLLLTWLGPAAWPQAVAVTIYVSPEGNDTWTGTEPQHEGDTVGPLRTPAAARDRLREMRSRGELGAARIVLRGGVYELPEPLVLTPLDSGTVDAPVSYEAYRGERPILSGGKRITGWREVEPGLFEASVVPAWAFRQLFVNGERRTRARTPNEGYFEIAGKVPPGVDPATGATVDRGSTAFAFTPGDIKPWPEPGAVEVVVFHSWETSRLRIAAVDTRLNIVGLTGTAAWPFESWGVPQRYYVENAPDALDAPGEWRLDVARGVVRYRPMPGEDMGTAEVIAPRLTQLLSLRGEGDLGLYVENVTFSGLTLAYQDWSLPEKGYSDPQAAVSIPAAVMADYARDCVIERCEVVHAGEHALWLRRGCVVNRVAQCTLHDLGAGGVRLGEASPAQLDRDESARNVVDNNHIYDTGLVYPSAVGIWIAQSSHNTVSHNEIHDTNYSGMSIGWNWDDADNRTHDNTIEFNHIHHAMGRMLNDGGAIYTLGKSPGSVIRNNVLHDVWPYDSIGWGVYLDATTSGYHVLNNVVYNTQTGGLMYSNGGHGNVIENNVFAYSAWQALWPTWPEDPNVVRRNIVYLTQGQMLVPFVEGHLRARVQAGPSLGEWDRNLYCDARGGARFFDMPFDEWQKLGLDAHSVAADPQFVDPASYDFRLKPGSPALELGFEPIDISGVGLYGDDAWVRTAQERAHAPTVLPAPQTFEAPEPIDDGFETTLPLAAPRRAMVVGELGGASIRVTDETASAGQRCLRITDAPGIDPSYQPHVFYQPHLTEGRVRLDLDILLRADAQVLIELRDSTPYPDCIGPSLMLGPSGTVTASGRALGAIPSDTWAHLEVECILGDGAPAVYSVRLTPRGGTELVAQDIPWTGTAFHAVHWLGFVSPGEVGTSVYVDELEFRAVPE